MGSLRVALLGGVPPALGGGGLERQLQMTTEALERRGHSVRHVNELSAGDDFDLLHVFGSGADVWQNIQHWRRHPAPLVVSPVIVCSPGAAERKLRLGAKLGLVPNINSMVRDLVRRADRVLAITEYERRLVEKLGASSSAVDVIPNGVSPSFRASGSPVADGPPYVVMLGSINDRKGQVAVLEGLGNRFKFCVIGGFEGSEAALASWRRTVASSGAEWLDEIHDPARVAGLLENASALVLMSSAEVQSLAVLEALALATPVVASPLPSHQELATRFPGWVSVATNISQAGAALDRYVAEPPRGPAPTIPSWDDVAELVESSYLAALASTSS